MQTYTGRLEEIYTYAYKSTLRTTQYGSDVVRDIATIHLDRLKEKGKLTLYHDGHESEYRITRESRTSGTWALIDTTSDSEFGNGVYTAEKPSWFRMRLFIRGASRMLRMQTRRVGSVTCEVTDEEVLSAAHPLLTIKHKEERLGGIFKMPTPLFMMQKNGEELSDLLLAFIYSLYLILYRRSHGDHTSIRFLK